MTSARSGRLPQEGYWVIEGNIGAGKTTLSRALAQDLEAEVLLEAFAENPFLPLFYSDPTRYALMVELYFMTERHQQLLRYEQSGRLFGQRTVADFYFDKTWLFAQQTLRGNERELFRRIYETMYARLPLPDKYVYLHRPIEVLLDNIRGRGRPYEQQIEADYLLRLQNAYVAYLSSERRFPVAVVQLGDLDMLDDRAAYRQLLDLVVNQSDWSGLQVIDLAGQAGSGVLQLDL